MILGATDEGDVWPLHSDIEYNGHKIRSIYLHNNSVLLENNSRCSYEQVFDYIRQRIL
jgi:hypothetical protein